MKQLKLLLPKDDIKSIHLAIESHVERLKEDLEKQRPGEYIRSVVEDEIVSLVKINLYLNEILNPKDEHGRPIAQR